MDFKALKNWIKTTAESENNGLCFMYDLVFVANKDLIGNWLLKALQKKLDKRDKSHLNISKIKVNQMLHTLREAQDRHYEVKNVRRFSQCGLSDEVQAPLVDECPNCGQRFETRIAEQYHKCNGGPCEKSNQQNHELNENRENQGVKPKESAFFCSWKNCKQTFDSKKEWRAHNYAHREEQPPTNLNQQSKCFQNGAGLKPKDSAFFCSWKNCKQTFNSKEEWRAHNYAHREEQPPTNLNQQSKCFENGAGVANKAKTRKRQLTGSSSFSSSSDEEYKPASRRQQKKKLKKKVKRTHLKSTYTKKQGNQSHTESETELQIEFGILSEEDDEATNFTSGMATPSHGYELRERINGSSRPTSPWLTKMTTRNSRPPSRSSNVVTPPNMLRILKNLKLRVESAVVKDKKTHVVSQWDYTYFKYTQQHLVDDILKMSKHNFDKKYNKIIAETLYNPCKHLGYYKKFERRCFWLTKKFIGTVDSSSEDEHDEDNDADGAYSDCSVERQNLHSHNNDPKEDEEDDHESVDLVTDADASDEDEFQPTSQSSSQPSSYIILKKPIVRLETLNGLEKEQPTTNGVAASIGPLLLTKMSPNKAQKPSTSAGESGQQKDFLIDESTTDTMDFSLQVSDPED